MGRSTSTPAKRICGTRAMTIGSRLCLAMSPGDTREIGCAGGGDQRLAPRFGKVEVRLHSTSRPVSVSVTWISAACLL